MKAVQFKCNLNGLKLAHGFKNNAKSPEFKPKLQECLIQSASVIKLKGHSCRNKVTTGSQATKIQNTFQSKENV